MKPLEIDVTDKDVQRGIIMVLSESEPLPTGAERLALIDRAVADFLTAELDLSNAQAFALDQLRTPQGSHSRCTAAAVDAYERKMEAQGRLATLLGVLVVSSARGR